MGKLYANGDDVYWLGGSAMAITGGAHPMARGATGTVPALSKENYEGKIAFWGEDNNWPDTLRQRLGKNSIVLPTIDKMCKLMLAGGLAYGVPERQDGGGMGYQVTRNPAIDRFLEDSWISRQLMRGAKDLYLHGQCFPMLSQSRDKSRIARFTFQAASNCRWGIMEGGRIKHGYVSTEWVNGASELEAHRHPVVDLYNDMADPIGGMKGATKAGHWFYPMNDPHDEQPYYPTPAWQAVLESGWLEFANKVPEFKLAVISNAIHAKYLVLVDREYWPAKFGAENWGKLSMEGRKKVMRDELDAFDEDMRGAHNAGKSFLLPFEMEDGALRQYWKVEPITNQETFADKWIHDSYEANAHLLYALGMDPSTVGLMPGSSKGNGSGSEKRIATNVHIQAASTVQRALLEGLNFAARYNGWAERFFLVNHFLNTADQVAPKDRL